MIKKTAAIPLSKTNVFDSFSEISIGKKIYLIERHFIGKRDYKQAIFTAAANEADREKPMRESPR
ncbi:MAG: hypothetical protein FWH57_10555 [Oscillospiraceae bacterium]|nr:hypothetical protein [Oscillospiraceae bacterium]